MVTRENKITNQRRVTVSGYKCYCCSVCGTRAACAMPVICGEGGFGKRHRTFGDFSFFLRYIRRVKHGFQFFSQNNTTHLSPLFSCSVQR